jgi:hypothetical protein
MLTDWPPPNMRPAPARTMPYSTQRVDAAVTAIKSVHTVIFLGMGSCVPYILYSGLTGRISRLTKASLVIVIWESLIFLGMAVVAPLPLLYRTLASSMGRWVTSSCLTGLLDASRSSVRCTLPSAWPAWDCIASLALGEAGEDATQELVLTKCAGFGGVLCPSPISAQPR